MENGYVHHGDPIEVAHTRELEIGDKIVIAFAPGHLGFFKYGQAALFTVATKTENGSVRFRDRDGTFLPPQPIRGSRSKLFAKIRELTDFENLTVYRPAYDPEPVYDYEAVYVDDEPATESMVPVLAGASVPSVLIPPQLIMGGIVVLALAYISHQNSRDDEEED